MICRGILFAHYLKILFLLVTLLLIFDIAGAAEKKHTDELFTKAPASANINKKYKHKIKDSTILREQTVRIKFDLLMGKGRQRRGNTVVLNLFDDAKYTARKNRIERRDGGYTWFGKLGKEEYNNVILVVKNGHMAGWVSTEGKTYKITYIGNDIHSVSEINACALHLKCKTCSEMHADKARESKNEKPKKLRIKNNTDNSESAVVDVMFVCTKETYSEYIDIDVEAMLTVAYVNEAYVNSGVNHRLNLVHTAQLSYSETGDTNTDFNALRYSSEVHSLRNQYNADLVTIVLSSLSGFGYIPYDGDSNYSDYGYNFLGSVSWAGVYAHESGHNMGGAHDWYMTENADPDGYNHGYVSIEGEFYTIVAYPNECTGSGITCDLIPFYSNPDITYKGEPTGVPEGSYHAADNVKTFNNLSETVSKYRISPPDGWESTTLYTGEMSGFYSTDIVLDNSDNVHIVYLVENDVLTYTTNKSGSWETQIVDHNSFIDFSSGTLSIDVDNSDKVHISYYDNSNGDLKYATNKSGTWETQTIDSNGTGLYTSIALDNLNAVHISYLDNSNGYLKYVTNSSGTWETQTIDNSGTTGRYTSIALDNSNNVHISYYDKNTGEDDLKYATNKSGLWEVKTVDSGRLVGLYTSLAIDTMNNVHISYYDKKNGAIKYANNKSGTWEIKIIDDGGFNSSLVVDSSGYIHINHIFEPESFDSNCYIIYTTNNASANPTPTPVQTSTIKGVVYDTTTGIGIEGAAVSTDVGGYSATTDSSGSYTLSNLEFGQYTLTVSASGYELSSQTITVTTESTITADFYLIPVVYTPGIAAGSGHSLSVDSDSSVWAWGLNDNGQLGNGNTENSNTYVNVSQLEDVVSLACGSNHSLALKSDGTIWAWGDNHWGQLGDGVNANSGVYNYKDYVVPNKTNLNDMIGIAANADYSMSLGLDGTVWEWGYMPAIDDGSMHYFNTPAQKSNVDSVHAIDCGNLFSLVLKLDGTVWAWGFNDYGQLGNAKYDNSIAPVRVSSITDVRDIACGIEHGLALKSDGTVWAWGWNYYGQLGNGTTNNSNTPVQVTGLSGVVAVAGGYYHSLALKSDGTVWAWGNNEYGQLGNGTTNNSNTPVQVTGLSGIADVAGGYGHSLAIKSDGTVWAWGRNVYGQLGNGTIIDSTTPVQVSNLDLDGIETTFTTPTPAPTPKRNGIVSGFVYNENIDPLQGVIVTIERNDYSNNIETDEEGYYEFNGLTSGKYTLVFMKYGYKTQINEVILRDGEILKVDGVIMEKATKGMIYGYVTDIHGESIESARLKLKGVRTKARRNTVSDVNGFFKFDDLDADTYVIFARKPLYKRAKKTVELKTEQEAGIDIEMKKIKRRKRGLQIADNESRVD